jgi:ADP-heptose:LPS heptosyltransferase
MGKVLVVGPYVGELGWELFSWQPMVRGHFLKGDYEKCIVYTKGVGKNYLYRFADEVRTFKCPDIEASGHSFYPEKSERSVKLLRQLSKMIGRASKREFDDIERLTPSKIKPLRLYFERGNPDRLYGDGVIKKPFKNKLPTVAFCIRDRELADDRNWSRHNWFKLVEDHIDKMNIVIIGTFRRRKKWAFPKEVYNMGNMTTIDDIIDIFGWCDLAVGGSTGTMHLASRCGIDHVVWGCGNRMINPKRYRNTNWNKAKLIFLPTDWRPSVKTVKRGIRNWLDTRE